MLLHCEVSYLLRRNFIQIKILALFTILLHAIAQGLSYRRWLGQNGPCCYRNMLASFSNTWQSFWFFLKPSKARLGVWKAPSSLWDTRPSVLKQALGRVFCQIEFMKISSVKSTAYSLQSSVIHLLIYILSATLTVIH